MLRGMIIVSVVYPKHGESHFDHEYYVKKHLPLVWARWGGMGLSKLEALRGEASMDGGVPAFELIALLSFDSMESVQAALAAAGAEILGDIPNFTNIQPVIQVNRPTVE
jgi:uncharacterized protein (TIGR02118 family)